MFNSPIIKKLNPNVADTIHIVLIIMMYIAACAEADMYVPAFPEMINHFLVAENQIQLVLSLNFAGLCVASLISGPLSDAYGRRKVLLGGLFVFFISSFGCATTQSFEHMLFFRLLQGIAISAPMVIGAATFFDRYTSEKAGQLIGVMNTFISASMAAAPIAGALISERFGWRANFEIIFLFSILIFVGTALFIEESLPIDKRKEFSLFNILKDYWTISKSFKFMAYSLIVSAPFVAVVVYIANLSIILVNHFGMSLNELGFYQATTMGTFIFFAMISVKLIAIKGIDYTKNIGGTFAVIGSSSMFLAGICAPTSLYLIGVSMAFIAAGSALMAGTFGSKAMSVFPEMNGTSMGMMNFMRQLMASLCVLLSELLYDGTIVPVANIIFGLAIICVVANIIVSKTNK